MLPKRLQRFADEPIPVLDDGHVMLVDVMGDDMSIVNAARVSYGAGTKKVSKDRHLVRYLMRNRHTTPFEMCEMAVRIRMPMDAHRQQIRHRTANVNEYSTRYSVAIDSAQKTLPTQWRSQAKSNKQGSDGTVTEFPEGFPEQHEDYAPGTYLSSRERDLQKLAREVYDERLKFGVAKEQARKDLPLSTYTEYYWKMDLHNLFHYLGLRMDPHAQLEIRAYANAIAEIVKVWVPWAWEAFEDYRLNGMYLTRAEVDGLRALLQKLKFRDAPMTALPLVELTPEQTADFAAKFEAAKEESSPLALNLGLNVEFPYTVGEMDVTAENWIEAAVAGSGLGKGRERDDLIGKLRKLGIFGE